MRARALWALCALAGVVACSSTTEQARRQAITITTQTTYFHAGFAAGPAVFTDQTGHVVEERRYEPYGVAIDAPGIAARDLNELNKRTDPSTGWSDHGARWLTPETGRWLTPDPPVAAPDDKFMARPWALHPYQYVEQNPVTYWDPDGFSPNATALPAPLTPTLPPVLIGLGRAVMSVGAPFLRAVPFVGIAVGPALSIAQHAAHPDEPALECDGCEIVALDMQQVLDDIAADKAAFGKQLAAAQRDALVRDRSGTMNPTIARDREGEGHKYAMRIVVHFHGTGDQRITQSDEVLDDEPIQARAMAYGVGLVIQGTGMVGEPGVTDLYNRVVGKIMGFPPAGTPWQSSSLPIVKDSTDDHSYDGAGLQIEVYNLKGWNLKE